MQKTEFHSIGELETVKGQLATASRRPVYIDIDREWEPREYGDPWRETHTDDRRVVEFCEKSALWNDRDAELSYISSEDYQLLQHSELLDIVQEAVDKTVSDVDMGVIRDYGAQIDGTLVFSNTDEALIDVDELVGDGYVPPEGDIDPHGNARARDALGLGMRLSNSFDGKKQLTFSTMGYRFICQNWMVWGEETIGETATRHVIPDEFESEDLSEDEEFIEYVRMLIEDTIDDVFEIKEELEPRVKEAENEEIPFGWVPGLLENAGFGRNYQKEISGLTLIQENPTDGETTAWRLYQAATTILDNDKAEKISKDQYDKHQGSAWNLMDEPSAPSETMTESEVREFAKTDI